MEPEKLWLLFVKRDGGNLEFDGAYHKYQAARRDAENFGSAAKLVEIDVTQSPQRQIEQLRSGLGLPTLGRPDLRVEGIMRERRRALEILALDMPRSLRLSAIKGGLSLEETKKLLAQPEGAAQTLIQEAANSLSLEEQVKAEWGQNPSIRREFGQVETYLAFRRAEASGLTKVVHGAVIRGERL